MNLREIDAVVASHDLNQHPFYRAWRAGTVPRSMLARYAADYAAFIESIPLGWETLGDLKHAEEEREHARLWSSFRDVLGASEPSSCPETAALADQARKAFTHPVDALGALYAFEAQQPSTARSKLEGLREHYGFSEEQAEYFRLHADDYGERDRLQSRLASLTPADFARAKDACAATCQAMYRALDGVMAQGA